MFNKGYVQARLGRPVSQHVLWGTDGVVMASFPESEVTYGSCAARVGEDKMDSVCVWVCLHVCVCVFISLSLCSVSMSVFVGVSMMCLVSSECLGLCIHVHRG